MSSFWLWVSLAFYSLGLAHALATIIQLRRTWIRPTMAAIGFGFTFHFVSLIELWMEAGRFPITNIAAATSLFAFLMTGAFLWAYRRYHMESLSVFVFPVVFVLTLAAAEAGAPMELASPLLAAGWVPVHVSLTLAGYAALVLSFLAGVMYLLQERQLKSKTPKGFYYRLPPLEFSDQLASRSLVIGFPLVTAGLIVGAVGAAGSGEASWIRDPKIILTFLFWMMYLLLVVSRVNWGWRGRRAAWVTLLTVALAIATWGANYYSEFHSFWGR